MKKALNPALPTTLVIRFRDLESLFDFTDEHLPGFVVYHADALDGRMPGQVAIVGSPNAERDGRIRVQRPTHVPGCRCDACLTRMA